MTCVRVKTNHLNAHSSLTLVVTKIELDSHADTYFVGDHCLIVHDHNRLVNIYGYNPKAVSKFSHIVDATVAYTEPKTDHFVIILINQVIEMKGLDHHLLCLMQCSMNGVLIDEVPKFLAPFPSETMHVIQLENPFHATQTNYFSINIEWSHELL